jgi:hypothetical protein
VNEPYHVRTFTINGRDWDEIDREETRQISAIIAGGHATGGWELLGVETISTGPTEMAGQHGVTAKVRAHFRRPCPRE